MLRRGSVMVMMPPRYMLTSCAFIDHDYLLGYIGIIGEFWRVRFWRGQSVPGIGRPVDRCGKYRCGVHSIQFTQLPNRSALAAP
jgi:hypothetical protein